MELKIHSTDRVRISTDQSKNYIDINGEDWEQAISVDLYDHLHYIELRKKEGLLRLYLFKNKGVKKEIDFGYFKDAEVVFALNNVKR